MSGYVVDASEPNIGNYLEQHTDFAEMVTHRLRAYGARVALLRNMTVDEDQRGNGIGTQLISEFMEEAGYAGATVYMLICDIHEGQALGFDLKAWYESFGFVAAMDTSEGPLMLMPKSLAEELAGLVT
nr:GNAT family N-acetyltransferase [Pseudomonas veronii]